MQGIIHFEEVRCDAQTAHKSWETEFKVPLIAAAAQE